MNSEVLLSPLLPYAQIALLALAAVLVLAAAKWRRAPDFCWRGGFFALLALLLLNPVVISEVRQALPRKLVVVLDESPSMAIAGRDKAVEKILANLRESLSGLEPVVVRAGQDATSLKEQNTSLFAALRNALMGIPLGQVAGTVLITDGQAHDVPESLGVLEKLAPFNVVLAGKKDEADLRVTVTEAPKYGLLGGAVAIKVRVDGSGPAPDAPLALDVRQDGNPFGQYAVEAGGEREFLFSLDHVGQNVFEFSIPAGEGELTAANNSAAVIVNGVRDRLRVLLVSGMPHIGERAWRNLLKSDPAIDLVHFTILRSPLSTDSTPARQMSLIAFPVEELFERKIRGFDLIIFDKYAQYGLLLPRYFDNIASFVREGGAFLMAMGSDAPEQSLFGTALGGILPVRPQPEGPGILSGSYLPQLTAAGKAHPVTQGLEDGDKPWGRWFTQAGVEAPQGQVLMTGAEGRPLLVLDQAGEGRVAALASDNIWLWAKGVNGGGPYTELLRNVAHWLMKEPELEEGYIKAEAKGNVITVSRRAPAGVEEGVAMTRPGGQEESVLLPEKAKGWLSGKVIAGENGIYRFSSGGKTAFAVVGTAVAQEFSDVRTTEEKLRPLVEKTGGALLWAGDSQQASLSGLRLKEETAYSVERVESTGLVPNALAALLVFAGLVFVWRRESGWRGPARPPG